MRGVGRTRQSRGDRRGEGGRRRARAFGRCHICGPEHPRQLRCTRSRRHAARARHHVERAGAQGLDIDAVAEEIEIDQRDIEMLPQAAMAFPVEQRAHAVVDFLFADEHDFVDKVAAGRKRVAIVFWIWVSFVPSAVSENSKLNVPEAFLNPNP